MAAFTIQFFSAKALAELAFGLGLIVGPSLGAWLYGMGGFPVPFLVFGISSFSSSLLYYVSFPSMSESLPALLKILFVIALQNLMLIARKTQSH